MSNPRKKGPRMTAQAALKISKKMDAKTKQVLSQVGSIGEEVLARHLQVHGLKYVREFKFNPQRNYRADFYLKEFNLLVEVEGGTKSKSRHTTHGGYSKDLMKYNSAQILGYSRLSFTTEQVNSGLALQTIKKFITARMSNVAVAETKQPPNAVIKELLHGKLHGDPT